MWTILRRSGEWSHKAFGEYDFGIMGMSDLRFVTTANSAGSGHDVIIGSAAVILGLTVFWIDTFTSIQSAIAVLYVIVLLLSGEILARKGVLISTGICATLTIISYLVAHGSSFDLPALLRFAVAISAVLITCALLLRNDLSRSALIASNAALKDSERRYRSIFEQSRVALWERDYSRVRTFLHGLREEGVEDFRRYAAEHPSITTTCVNLIRTVAYNDAARELLGAVGGKPGDDSVRPYLAPNDTTFLELMDAIFKGEPHYEGRGTIRTASGEAKLVLMSMSFPEDAADFERIVVGMIDITEREMTQKALLEAQAELTRAARAATVGALSASLAHELNQPLGALVVNAQTMLRWIDRDPPDVAAVRRSAERMIRDSQRASDIIHNTRSMLSHELQPPEHVDLLELIRETRALMDHDLGRDGVSVDVSYGENAKSVVAVRIELQQVLVNLLSNAIQAMSESSSPIRRLVIETARQDDRMVRISVRDFGPGIPEGAVDKLFAPFFTTKSAGMGMGLSICRSIMEMRGGELLARNHPDGGAVFDMIIPAEDDNNG